MNASQRLRMRVFESAGLYLVTSAEHSAGRSTETVVAGALEAGVRLVQLREKSLSGRELFRLALRMRALTDAYGALLIINDRIDIAMAAGADGVHLGRDDFPVAAARDLAPDAIIGASAHNLEEALEASREGASYVNIGPLFPTGTKEWQGDFIGWDGLRGIAPLVKKPFTVMGGIKMEHLPRLLRCGARTIAVVTAVTAAPDPGAAAAAMLKKIRTALRPLPCPD